MVTELRSWWGENQYCFKLSKTSKCSCYL